MQDKPSRNLTLISGIIGGKCPHCRTGKMFRYPFWNLWRFASMNKQCEHCGQDFQVEPGFYYGAMYFTYIVNVIAIMGSVCVMFFGFDVQDPILLSLPVAIAIVLLMPLNFRLSRILWLYFFGDINYQPGAQRELPFK